MEPNDPRIYAVAGLLHDIGKFWQRADALWKESKHLDQAKGMVEYICPHHQGQGDKPGYQHVIWTYAFLNKYYEKFKDAGIADKTMMQDQFINLASYHHQPSTPNQGLITLADICSSGLDRSNEQRQANNPEWGWDKYKSRPFVSPFAILKMETGEALDFAYAVQKMSIGKGVYPSLVADINNKNLYPDLWREFESEFEQLPDANRDSFIYSLVYLLKKYVSFIPASTQDYPESSLFEHLKTTGAFAHCFAAYKAEYPEAFGTENRIRHIVQDHYPLKLFCGDISGIQSFIYNITNKAAAKSLKGRSFYVQLLAESIAQELLRDCGCTIINQVYASGGKFYLLLPNTRKVNEEIKEYRQKLEKKLWDKFRGHLSVNMEGINFSIKLEKKRPSVLVENESEPIDIGQLWKRLSDRTSLQKRRKFSNVFQSEFANWFEPHGVGGDVDICSVSGRELDSTRKEELNAKDVEQGTREDLFIDFTVKEQIDIGWGLYEHKYLVELITNARTTSYDAGYDAGVNSCWNMLKEGDTANQQYIRNWIRTDHKDEIEIKPQGFTPHKDNGLGWRLYGGNRMASRENKIATFEELAALTDGEKGARLGVLRMDVDNLGELFKNGFPEQKRSFSTLATMSSMLDLFFSGHLNFIRNQDKYCDYINIIYSGGDDVFAVGHWNKLISFAADVREAFKKFVCGRDDISLSAGMVMVGPKFPIAKAADLAGEAEEKAKKYKHRKTAEEKKEVYNSRRPDKNAFTLFSIALSWKHDWSFVVQFKNDLVEQILYKEIISKGLLMKLFDYYAQYARGEPDWQWNSAYTIARMKSRDNQEKNKVLDDLKILLYCNNYKNNFYNIPFEAVITAARWAEWEIRYLKK